MSLPGWIICCGPPAASSSARPFIVFSSVPPLLCAFGSCTLNRTSWTTRDHLQETQQFAVGCSSLSQRFTPLFHCQIIGMRHRGSGSLHVYLVNTDVRLYMCAFIWNRIGFPPPPAKRLTCFTRRCRATCVLLFHFFIRDINLYGRDNVVVRIYAVGR